MSLQLDNAAKRMYDEGRTAHLAKTLSQAKKFDKVIFEPDNLEHRKAYAAFLKYGKWTTMRFHIEAPFNDVVITINHKLLRYSLADELAMV